MSDAGSHPAPLVEFREVSRSFSPGAVALDAASLSLGADRYVVVVGPSGCGKTTLLRLIAGLERPQGGSIRLSGEDASTHAPHTRPVALAAQGAPLYPHLSVLENLGFAARARGATVQTVRERVDAVAAALELTPLLSRRPGELSGGQRQRVALGRAMVQQAAITLLDEPLAALEPELRGRVAMLLRRQQRETGGLFVHVTHDHEEAASLADELVVMRAGHVRQHAQARTVLTEPSDRFVAEFLAEPRLNAFEGRLEMSGDVVRFVGAGLECAVPDGPALARGREVVMTVAPDAVVAVDSDYQGGGLSGSPRLEGVTTDITRRAGRAVLHVKVGGSTLRAVMPASGNPAKEPAIGARIRLAVDASKALFFAPGPTGARITGA